MSKTTVNIDDKLLEEAMKVSGAKTKRQAIIAALEELVHRKNLEALRRELGTFDLALSLDDLEKLNRQREQAAREGRVVYGPVRYSQLQYYGHWKASLQVQAKELAEIGRGRFGNERIGEAANEDLEV